MYAGAWEGVLRGREKRRGRERGREKEGERIKDQKVILLQGVGGRRRGNRHECFPWSRFGPHERESLPGEVLVFFVFFF